jgi:hypothetical protein
MEVATRSRVETPVGKPEATGLIRRHPGLEGFAMRSLAPALLLALAACATNRTDAPPTSSAAPIVYPQTMRGDVVEAQFGERIDDPYRWLENDVREDPRVRAWVTAQNEVTFRFLEGLPARNAFRARMRELYDYERFGLPEKAGNFYFYTRNSGLQPQSPLYVREGSIPIAGRPTAPSRSPNGILRPTAATCSIRSRTAAPTGASCASPRRRPAACSTTRSAG